MEDLQYEATGLIDIIICPRCQCSLEKRGTNFVCPKCREVCGTIVSRKEKDIFSRELSAKIATFFTGA